LNHLYLDTSALLKTYIAEEFTDQCREIIAQYSNIYISQIGITEAMINMRKRLSTREFAFASNLFKTDTASFNILDFDEVVSDLAIEISASTSLATLDAIHIASVLSLSAREMDFLTYDKAQRKAAKSLGLRTP
jgi:predicted nucleic acid-binding protein